MNPAKVVAELSKIMAERIAYASSRSDGIGSGEVPQTVAQQAGYQTPWAYCEAKDVSYQVAQRAMKAGEE